MLSSEQQNNLRVVQILSDIYDSDKVNFVKSISDIIVEAGFANTVILPNSILAGNLRRNGSEIKLLDIKSKNTKTRLSEIAAHIDGVDSKHNRVLVHNHEIKLSKEIQKMCRKRNIHNSHSIFSKPKKENIFAKVLGSSSTFSRGLNVATVSYELKKYFAETYPPLISTLSVVPIELPNSVGKVPHERMIALATSWGILDQPSLILLTKEFYGNKKWEKNVLELGKALQNFQQEQSVQLIILDSRKENLLRDKFQESIASQELLNFINPVKDCSDFEAAVSIASIYLDLSPEPPETSSILQKCAEQGRLCIAWRHGANVEAFSQSNSNNLVEPFNFTLYMQKIREFLLFSKEKTKCIEGKNQKYVREKYNRNAVKLALFDFYNKTLGETL